MAKKTAMELMCLILLLCFFAGCASYAELATKSWVGAPIEKVIAAWGNPNSTTPLKKGERKYTWWETRWEWEERVETEDEIKHREKYNIPYIPSYENVEYTCTRVIIADISGMIRDAYTIELCDGFDAPPSY